jgi:hypothetical protein
VEAGRLEATLSTTKVRNQETWKKNLEKENLWWW